MDFYDINFSEVDKDLTPEERAEWQSIYASIRSGSIMTGTMVGTDIHEFSFVPKGETKAEKQTIRCAIVIPYRVKIIIPETEMSLIPMPEGGYVLHSMGGAKLEFIITHVDRENGIAVASRKKALEKLMFVTNRRDLQDKIIETKVMSVGKNVCVINYGGYDVLVHKRDVNYSLVPDLRNVLHPGEIKKAKVMSFNPDEGKMKLSIKATMPHPFDGVETRHPVGTARVATVVGKYGGGVFCRLYDGVTDVLCAYDTMHYDGDFNIGDKVEIVIRKLNYDKKVVYGKMIRKMC